jgi:hypothetical protein
LQSIGADEEVGVYGTLPPQPSVAPHALGTGDGASVALERSIIGLFPVCYQQAPGFPFPST